jgi:hypothetical protein
MTDAACHCLDEPLRSLTAARWLGTDERYAEVSLMVCADCGRRWLRYFFEIEAFSRSGRWYLGLIESDRDPTAGEARALLESLPWYHYGGSYYDGRTGRASGPID